MKKLNWKQRLLGLKGLDEGDDEVIDARNAAEVWGCCSVAERFLQINKNWEKLTADDRYQIMSNGPNELFMMGTDFSTAVDEQDYECALEIHKQIQNYPIDEKVLSAKINSSLGRF